MALNRYPVIWADRAVKEKDAIEQYLKENWSVHEVKEFFSKLEERIVLLSTFPVMFPLIEGTEESRRSVLTKHISIFYEFIDEPVELLSILIDVKSRMRLSLIVVKNYAFHLSYNPSGFCISESVLT